MSIYLGLRAEAAIDALSCSAPPELYIRGMRVHRVMGQLFMCFKQECLGRPLSKAILQAYKRSGVAVPPEVRALMELHVEQQVQVAQQLLGQLHLPSPISTELCLRATQL